MEPPTGPVGYSSGPILTFLRAGEDVGDFTSGSGGLGFSSASARPEVLIADLEQNSPGYSAWSPLLLQTGSSLASPCCNRGSACSMHLW